MTPGNTIAVSVGKAFNASAEQVFDAWLDPAMVPQWFAPGLGDMTRIDIDRRLGGVFNLDQRRGDSIVHHWGVYLELDRPNRLVFTWCVDDAEDEDIVSIDISPTETGCEVTIRHQIDAAHADYADATRQGWSHMLEGLEQGLSAPKKRGVTAEGTAGKDDPRLTVIQGFLASPDQLFKAWTLPALAGEWLFTSPHSEHSEHHLDPRPGGRWTIQDRRDQTDYIATGEYLAVERPYRLVFTFAMPQFSPNSDTITVTIEPEGDGSTLTLVQEGPDIAAELQQLPEDVQTGTEAGWINMFNNLGGLLARRSGHGIPNERHSIRFERRLPGTPDEIWAWLTQSDKRAQWLAAGDMPAEVGAEFTLKFHHAALSPHQAPTPARYREYEGGVDSRHRMLHWEPSRHLIISWGSGDGEKPSEVSFKLTGEGEHVHLILTHSQLADHEAMIDVAGGWHTHLAVLSSKLAGITPPPFWTLMEGIEEDYRQRIGTSDCRSY